MSNNIVLMLTSHKREKKERRKKKNKSKEKAEEKRARSQKMIVYMRALIENREAIKAKKLYQILSTWKRKKEK